MIPITLTSKLTKSASNYFSYRLNKIVCRSHSSYRDKVGSFFFDNYLPYSCVAGGVYGAFSGFSWSIINGYAVTEDEPKAVRVAVSIFSMVVFGPGAILANGILGAAMGPFIPPLALYAGVNYTIEKTRKKR